MRLSSIACRVDTTGGNHKRAASMGPFPGHLLISKPFYLEVSGLDVNNTYSGRQSISMPLQLFLPLCLGNIGKK